MTESTLKPHDGVRLALICRKKTHRTRIMVENNYYITRH